jgi:hypothetical protein
MQKLLDELLDKLRKTFDQRLVSVILYGSAAGNDTQERFSDLNILCVLSQVTPAELADGEAVFRWWRGHGHPSPLLLSRVEVATSTDCFPMEFHDLAETRRVLHGEDVCRGLVIDTRFYRAIVEHELRARLLRLRQKAGSLMSDREVLTRLMADSVATFCVLGRHALRLAGRTAPARKRDVAAALESDLGIRVPSFYKLLDLREGVLKPRGIDPVPLLASYLTEIGALVALVDGLKD